MPISSGAGGRTTRSHLTSGTNKRTYWSNNANNTSGKSRTSTLAVSSISLINQELLGQRPVASSSSASTSSANNAEQPVKKSRSTSNLTSDRENQHHELASRDGQVGKKTRIRIKRQQGGNSSKLGSQQKLDTAEKYKRIRHISRPSSHSTTSPGAIKYFTGDNIEGLCKSDLLQAKQSDDNDVGLDRSIVEINSLAGKSVDGTRSMAKFSLASALNFTTNPDENRTELNKNNADKKPSSVLASMITIGANSKANNYRTNNETRSPSQSTTMKRLANGANLNLATAHYSTTSTISQHNSQTSLNPSLSPAFNISGNNSNNNNNNNNKIKGSQTTSGSTSSSTANLHSLSSLHQQPTTTINKRISLKYVKTLIVLLMSLDLIITIFVHRFASQDEFSLAFISSKLRFSLVNLVLSAIWFIVLTGAILFDIYFILVIGCVVDVASFILLLTCSTIHFTQRIDYNTVSLTSLLLLLFSIIVLHVYLVVIASLTIYLMLAVKRRRKH